jgi:hypothetical protein
MTLMCVDYPNEAPPFLINGRPQWSLTENDRKKTEDGTTGEAGTAANIRWIEKELVVIESVNYVNGNFGGQTDGNWFQLIEMYMFAPLRRLVMGGWKGWPGFTHITDHWYYKKAIEDLAEWNPGLFTDERLQPQSFQSYKFRSLTRNVDGGPVVAVPTLKPGEKVIYRHPWMPSYVESEGERLNEQT